MTVSLSQVLASARARSAPLAGECAGYLVLAAADDAARGPRRIEAGSVELHPDGSVRVVGGSPSDEATTERDLRDLLDELLLVAGSVTPALLRSARRRTGVGIDGLVREIETALIPVNRGAARRALSRLERETSRAVERGGLVVENQRVSDRALVSEPPAASAPQPAALPAPTAVASEPMLPAVTSEPVPPAVSFERASPAVLTETPPPAVISETPPPASLTPPPVSAPEARASSLPSTRPATDLLPTPVAVPVRPRIVLEAPLLDETPSKLETRPETVVARATQRPPARPSWPVSPPPKPEPRSLSRAPRASVAVTPCAPPPVESMTPFLGTATAQRAPAPPFRDRDVEDELDVPIDVEVLVTELPVVAEVPVVAAAALDEVAEEDVVEESPDELTEPFFLDREGHEDVGLAFHELTALMAPVAPIAEPVIELAESPAPATPVLEESSAPATPVLEGRSAPATPVLEESPAPATPVLEESSAPATPVLEESQVAVALPEPAAEVGEEVVVSPAEAGEEAAASAPEAGEEIAEEVVVSPVEAVEEIAEVVVSPPETVEAVAEAEPPAPPRGEFEDVELAVLLPSAEPPPVLMRRPASDPAALLPRRPLPQKQSSNVDELLSSFSHGAGASSEEEDVRSTLKRLAGLEPTPPPPDATRS